MSSVKKGKLTQEKFEKTMSRLKGVLDYESFKDVDMVIEVLDYFLFWEFSIFIICCVPHLVSQKMENMTSKWVYLG